MFLVTIRCYFRNSEDFLNSIDKIRDVKKERIPGGNILTGLFMYDEWVLYIDKETLEWFRNYIKENDYDIEIEAYKEEL